MKHIPLRRLLTVALFAAAPCASAASLSWDSDGNFANGSTDGSGDWDTATANWNNGAADVAWPDLVGDTAVFGAGGTAGTVNVSGTVNVGALTFNAGTTGNYTIAGGMLNGLGTITNNAAGTTTTNSNITRTGTLTLNGGNSNNLALGGQVNATALNLNGLQTVTLNGTAANATGNVSFVGGQTANKSTLILAKTSGTTAVTGNITMGFYGGSGELRLGASDQIADTSIIALNAGGSYGNNASFNLLGYNETIGWLSGSHGAGGSDIVQNGAAGNSVLTLAGNGGSQTISQSAIQNGGTGTLSIIKNGTGTQVFNCNLSYTGTTTVNAGTLTIQNNAFSSSATTVAGGTLDFQGAGVNAAITGSTGQVTITGGINTNFGGVNKTYSVDTILSGNSTLTQTAANSLSAASIHNIGSGSTLRTGNLAGSVKGLAGSGTADLNGAAANLTIADGGNQVFSGAISGAGKLTKTGSGTQALTGANSHTGGTVVTGGTLIGTSTSALGTNSGLTVGSGAAFAYEAAAAGALNLGTGVLNLANGSRIGTSVGGTAGQSAITSSSAAVTTGTVTVDVYGIPDVAPTDGTHDLITAASGLDGATYALGNVYNTTNFFTVSGLSSSATAVSIITTSATALTAEYWKGGFSGGNNVWAVSDGSTASNWTTDAGGIIGTSLTPGAAATIHFSASGATNQGAMTLGANMSVAGIVVSDSSAIGLNADGNTLTLGTAGITLNSGAGAVSLAAPIILDAAQTWANNSSNALTVSGVLSGTGGLAKDGSGALVLTGANTHSGGTTLNAGATSVGNNSALGTGTLTLGGGALQSTDAAARTFANAIAFNASTAFGSAGTGDLTFSGAVGLSAGSKTATIDNTRTTFSGAVTGAGAGLVKEGTGTLTLSNAGTNYNGATTVNAGTLNLQDATGYVSATTVNNGGTLTVTNSASRSINTAITLNDGATLTHNGQNAASQYWTNSQAVTVAAGAAVTLNETSLTNATGTNKNTFLDGGLAGGGVGSVVTINATNAGNAFVLRANGGTYRNSAYAGKIIVNGIANGTLNMGSGLAVAGETTGLQNADLEVNGTLELGNQGLGWAGTATGTTFTMGALTGTGVVTNNNATVARALTVGNTDVGGTFSGILQNGISVLALTKIGGGTQTLSGANTYTGATTANGGTLQLDFQAGATADIVSASSVLTLGGGTLEVRGGSGESNTQTFNGLGGSGGTLAITANGAASVDISLAAVSLAMAVNFTGSDATAGALGNFNFRTSTTTTGDDGTTRLGAAMWNGTNWASTSSQGGANRVVEWVGAATDLTTDGNSLVNPAGDLRILDGAGTGTAATYSANTAVSSLIMQAPTYDSTVNFGGHTLTFGNTADGIGAIGIAIGAKSLTLGAAANDGVLTAGSSGASTLVLNNQSAGSLLTVNAAITNGASASVAVKTTGDVTLNGTNIYTGATTVNSGTLKAGSAAAFGTDSAVTVASAGTLDLGGFSNTLGSLAGPGTATNSGGSAVTLTAGGDNTSTTFSGVIAGGTGGLALTKAGTGTMTLSGSTANTYTGLTTVTGAAVASVTTGLKLAKADGVVAIQGDITLSNAGSNSLWFAPGSNNQLGGNGVLTFTNSAAGHGRFMLEGTTQSLAGINNSNGNGVVQNAEANFDGGTANTGTGTLILTGSGTYAFGGHLRSQTGTLALNKAGSGTQTLSGANITYTGATSVTDGTLVLNGTSAFASATAVTDGTLRLTGTSASSGTITNSSIVEFNGTGAFNGALAGAGTFNKTGAGIFQITNVAGRLITTTGQFNIQAGTLQNNFNNVNWSGNTADIDISSGAILDLYADAIHADALTGAGFVQNNYGNATNQSGSAAYYEKLVLGINDGTGTFSGVIRNNATNAALGAGVGKGGIDVVKTGTGTQTFSGANTYTGATTVNNGTLLVNGTHNAGAGIYTVSKGANASATLGGGANLAAPGTINSSGQVGISADGQITGGDLDTIGTLRITGSGGIHLAGTYLFDVDYAGTEKGDLISTTTAAQSAVVLGGVFELNSELSATPTAGSHYAIKIFESTNGVSGVGPGQSDYTNTSGLASYQSIVTWDGGKTYYLVPEPASFALLGLGSLLLLRRPSRRRGRGLTA